MISVMAWSSRCGGSTVEVSTGTFWQDEPRKLNDFNGGVFFAPIAPKPEKRISRFPVNRL
jgi:hypothetical protein